jgi:hypothetical protein
MTVYRLNVVEAQNPFAMTQTGMPGAEAARSAYNYD